MKPLLATALPVLALLLSSCAAPASADSLAASMKPPLPATGSPALVTAAAKHNGSGVRLRYGVPAGIGVGQASSVRLLLSGVTAADGAQVEVRSLTSGNVLASFALARGETRDLDLPLPPMTDGMHYLNVMTTQAGRSSVQSVPLKVGAGRPALKTEGRLQTTPDGEKILSLPAGQ